MKTNVVLLTIVMFIGTACSLAATEPAKVKEVALFKNGLGYFVSEITPPDKQPSFTITPPAAPTHGSFWLSYPDKVELKSFIAREKEIEEQLATVNIPELLKANIGKKVRLVFDKDEQAIECTIKYFPQERTRPIPDPYAPGHDSGATRDYGNYPPYLQPAMMIVESQTGQMCLNPGTIKRVEFADGSVEKTFSSKTKRYQLEVTLAAPANGKKLLLSQLSKGITWAPSYIIDITDPDKATISAKAEIINEACDLNDVVVHLVTGYPHLQFADVVSPMAMKENLAQFLQALTKGESEHGPIAAGAMRRVMSQRADYAYERDGGMPGIMPAYGAAATGTIAEDLFFYPIEKIHLAKGEVGYFPLFTESVPYKHIYTWDIPDYLNEQDRYNQRQQEQPKEEEVWHCVRLENTGKTPWTTAPAETIKDGLILGQDTLNYTPAKGKSTLRITQAVNVKAEQVERETQRQRDALHLYGDNFDLITVEGKLSIANVQPKAVTVEIAKTLSGDVKTMQPEANIEKLAKGLKSMNSLAKLTWTIELEPNERKELSYTYAVYVRR